MSQRLRLIVTVNLDDDVDEQEIVDAIWSKANDIVDIAVLDKVER